MKKYITYGNGNKYNEYLLPEKENLIIENSFLNKIQGTLWGSPVDAEYGWKDWCSESNFRNCDENNSFIWTLKDDAKVLFVEEMEDLEKVPFQKTEFAFSIIDFEKIVKEYDAIELSYEKYPFGHMFISEKEAAFNSWDCSSIMVFDKTKIVEL